MKKFLLGVLSIFAVLCLVACGGKEITLQNLTIEGQKTEFFVGDNFEQGSLKVTAIYSDETTKDVTSEAKVEQNANMNNAGTYAVLVSYDNITKAYEITVVDNKTIASISLDVKDAKLEYVVGETINYEGVKVIETYKNTANIETISYGELSKYDVKVTDENNNEVKGTFTQVGKYTVTVSKDNLVTSYEVKASYKSFDTVDEALESAVANANKVVSGNIIYKEPEFKTSQYQYVFGKNHFEVNTGESTTYYQKLSNGEPFGVTNYDGELSKNYGVQEEHLEGVYISSFAYYFDEIYGIENLLVEIKNMASDNEAKSYNYKESAEKCPSCGYVHEYSYSLETILSGYLYTYITVSFTLDGINGNIATANITLQGFQVDDMDYDKTNDKYTLKEDITEYALDNTIETVQVAGERTAENPYKAEDYLFSSFDLTDAENNKIGTEISSVVREQILLNITNTQPATANVSVDEIDVVILDESGEEASGAYGYYGSYDSLGGDITITAYKAGTYTVTVKSTLHEITFTLKAGYAELESLTPAVLNEWWELEEATEATVKENMMLTFNVVANDGADASCTVKLETETSDALIEFDGENYTFVSTKVGTYVIVFTSTVNSEIVGKLEVTVEEGVKMSELLNGEYTYSSFFGTSKIDFAFVPESEGAVKGSLTITDGTNVGQFTYEFDEEMATLDVTPAAGSESFEYSVTYDSTTQSLWCVMNGWAEGELVRKETTVEGELGGTYTGSSKHPMTGMSQSYTLVFNSDGTGTFDFFFYYVGSFNWELGADNTITFTNVVEDWGATAVFTGTFDADNNSINFTYEITEEGAGSETLTVELTR